MEFNLHSHIVERLHAMQRRSVEAVQRDLDPLVRVFRVTCHRVSIHLGKNALRTIVIASPLNPCAAETRGTFRTFFLSTSHSPGCTRVRVLTSTTFTDFTYYKTENTNVYSLILTTSKVSGITTSFLVDVFSSGRWKLEKTYFLVDIGNWKRRLF